MKFELKVYWNLDDLDLSFKWWNFFFLLEILKKKLVSEK